ncbi:MAG: diaminopimelate epimerase [Candidatus Omnitrophota bacterium]|jgi:diaminopimelate epimerase
MIKALEFTKMVASGNDFVVIENKQCLKKDELQSFAQEICDRKFGVGADGLLVLEKSIIADVKMRIFNANGSEAEMCGNGARCVACWVSNKRKIKNAELKIETKAGMIESEIINDNISIKLTDPKSVKLNILLNLEGRKLYVNLINTGVPHAVIFVEGLDKIDVVGIGRKIRFLEQFSPAGTNVNFIELINENSLRIRTYERGVEDETLACGTGAVAAALIFAMKTDAVEKIFVHTQSKEIVTVYFDRNADVFKNVWLEGKARIVFQGQFESI